MSNPRLLLIEDDIDLAELTTLYLSQQGFDLTHTESAEAALALPEQAFELIICDVMLPGESGFSVFEQLKKRYQCTLIFMTALDGQEDQIKGLDIGASDYIVKPINPELLTARIRANLRKASAQTSNLITLDGLTIDNSLQQITIDSHPLKFTTQEFNLLWIFARRHGQVLSREYLFEQYVGRPYDGLDRAIDLKVSRLRKKVDSYQIEGLSIQTVHGRGYLFNYQPKHLA
ncbi:response regulator transcription factor [Shewanella sp. Isolate11]|uniref:response regulator transcription factor n=1 Tax=Shewanella sp. Isolate11 TaxID=2908530 RepID=UPI001EFEEBF1|nr:response regulator transcription factor [Shewanella sp. Isolate11]MCG9697645.1 response regulator transcription factor [Shewanella sp. Isolate11]